MKDTDMEVTEGPTHDTPTLEQRVADLEIVLHQATIDLQTALGRLDKHRSRLEKLWKKVFPAAPPNCENCGRQMLVRPGAPCPVCGMKQ